VLVFSSVSVFSSVEESLESGGFGTSVMVAHPRNQPMGKRTNQKIYRFIIGFSLVLTND
jgi:hypothetical protein